jgi:hypothetical protein
MNRAALGEFLVLATLASSLVKLAHRQQLAA